MQLIRNCTGEIRAKTSNHDLIGCVYRAKSCNCHLIGCFCGVKTCNSPWLDNFGWRWFLCFWFSNAEFCFPYYFHVLQQSDAITFWLSHRCVRLVQEMFRICRPNWPHIMFTDWCLSEIYVIILTIKLMNYALNFIYFKSFLERYVWLKNAFILVFTLGF